MLQLVRVNERHCSLQTVVVVMVMRCVPNDSSNQ